MESGTRERVKGALDKELAIRAVQDAIKIPSVFGEEEEIGKYLAGLMRDAGLEDVVFQEVQEKRANVIGTLGAGNPGPTLVLQGHMDTVPPGAHPEPFSGSLRDGRIWGRGASDMKGPLVAAILAVGVARRIVPEFYGSCVVAATVDEESEKRGIFALTDRGLEADFGICVEPTDLRVAIAQKGCLSIRVTTHGVAAHGATPERGVNAIEKMAEVIGGIRNARVPIAEVPRVGQIRGTYNIGVIEGGQMFFIVPDRCSIWVDRRTVPGETQEDAVQSLRQLVLAICPEAEVVLERQDWKWERIQRRGIRSCFIAPESRIVRTVADSVECVTGQRAEYHVQNAWCETDFLINDLDIPTVNFGPGKMELAHTSNEHIEVESLLRGIETLAMTIISICGAKETMSNLPLADGSSA
jgi:acetylornithine deacetylase/succinyl-diaminopimelate desuccinylase family protein